MLSSTTAETALRDINPNQVSVDPLHAPMPEVHLSTDNVTAVTEAEDEMTVERQQTRASHASRMV